MDFPFSRFIFSYNDHRHWVFIADFSFASFCFCNRLTDIAESNCLLLDWERDRERVGGKIQETDKSTFSPFVSSFRLDPFIYCWHLPTELNFVIYPSDRKFWVKNSFFIFIRLVLQLHSQELGDLRSICLRLENVFDLSNFYNLRDTTKTS